MSLISALTGVGASGGSGGTTSPPASSGSANTNDKPKQTADPTSTTGSQGSSGGSAAPAAPAETTQTASRIPPVTAARAVNVTSQSRSGGEGIDETARLDAAFATSFDETQARREAEAAQRKLIQKELLSRIPVPIEAIPKLTGSVEEVRSIDDQRQQIQVSA